MAHKATNKKNEVREMRTIKLNRKEALSLKPNQWIKYNGKFWTVQSIFNGWAVIVSN